MTSGLVSVSFRALSPAEIISLARQAILRSVEWGGDVHVPHGNIARAREVRNQTLDGGLEVAAYGSYYRAGESEHQGLAFSSVLETAIALGAKKIRIWAGSENAENVNEPQWNEILRDIERVSRLATDADVQVMLEFHANTLTNSYTSAHRLLQGLHGTGIIWQPISSLSPSENLKGLKMLSHWIQQAHCFHAVPPNYAKSPLETGEDSWRSYLAELSNLRTVAHILVEFVAGNSPTQLLADAKVLNRMLGNP